MKKPLVFLVLISVFCTTSFAQKFGYVDTKYILSHIPEYQSAQAEINKLSSQWQKDIETKYANIEKLSSAYQAEKILLTDDMRKKREEDIEKKKQEAKEMQKTKFGVDGELFKKREELVKPIQDRIFEAIKEVAEQMSLMVVFDKANHSNMLYTNPKHDISDKVLKKMGLKPGEILEEEGEGGEESEDGNDGERPQPKDDKGSGKTQPRNSKGDNGGKK